jgi:hypothetical protein
LARNDGAEPELCFIPAAAVASVRVPRKQLPPIARVAQHLRSSGKRDDRFARRQSVEGSLLSDAFAPRGLSLERSINRGDEPLGDQLAVSTVAVLAG